MSSHLLRRTVSRVIDEEAARVRVDVDAVLGRSRRAAAVIARQRAILRVYTETGCSHDELARAWGISTWTVRRAVNSVCPQPLRGAYARLCWAHGRDQAKAIVAGRDQATNADVEAWRNLGRRRAA